MAQNNYIVPDHVPVPDIEDVELEAPIREVGVQCNLGGADRYYLVLNIEDFFWRVEEVRPLEEDEMGVEIVEEVAHTKAIKVIGVVVTMNNSLEVIALNLDYY